MATKNAAQVVATEIFELIEHAVDSMYIFNHDIYQAVNDSKIDIRKISDSEIFEFLLPMVKNYVEGNLEAARSDADEFDEE